MKRTLHLQNVATFVLHLRLFNIQFVILLDFVILLIAIIEHLKRTKYNEVGFPVVNGSIYISFIMEQIKLNYKTGLTKDTYRVMKVCASRL